MELTRGDGDFASSVGIGALVGSNFTLGHLNPPAPPPEDPDTKLSSGRKEHFRKWLKVARQYPLWKGSYRGELYDIGFDKPEAHVVDWNGKTYFAFFAEEFDGQLELRGLKESLIYSIRDYPEDKELGKVAGNAPRLKAKFHGHLLLEAAPVQPSKESK